MSEQCERREQIYDTHDCGDLLVLFEINAILCLQYLNLLFLELLVHLLISLQC